MAKKDGKKKTPGIKNPDRKNGKAFSKKKLDDKGRPLTGRGKPTGRTIKGCSVDKISRQLDDILGKRNKRTFNDVVADHNASLEQKVA